VRGAALAALQMPFAGVVHPSNAGTSSNRILVEVARDDGDHEPSRAEAELGQMSEFGVLNSFTVYICAIRGVQIT